GLLLMNGVVYAGFGSHCDDGQFVGWIIGVTTSGVIRTRYTTVANTTAKRGGGIWMSGSGLVSDGPGQILFATGNGYANPFTNPLPGNAPPGDLSTAAGRAVAQTDCSLKTTDIFAPFNAVPLGQARSRPSGTRSLPETS